MGATSCGNRCVKRPGRVVARHAHAQPISAVGRFLAENIDAEAEMSLRHRSQCDRIDPRLGRLTKNGVSHPRSGAAKRSRVGRIARRGRDARTRMAHPLIALLTDFGTRDPFVGVMKGVILGRCEDARIVDLTHEISPQNVVEGAFWLERSVPYFPAGTVFVAVVDPGVGSERRGVVAYADEKVFVAPDNGLVTAIVERASDWTAREIDVNRLGLPEPSATFHGRDVFAPVAAEIAAARLEPSGIGTRVERLSPSPLMPARASAQEVVGAVVTIDHFGNLITNIDGALLRAAGEIVVAVGNASLSVARTYADIEPGACAGVVNSFGMLEIARREGSAAQTLDSQRGDRVVVSWRPVAWSLKIPV